jgi:hypothetical protein
VLGKLIDEHDDAKEKQEDKDDVALQVAKYFKVNFHYLII